MAKQLRTRTEYTQERLEELQRVMGQIFAKKQNRRKRGGLFLVGGLCLAGAVVVAALYRKPLFPALLALWGAAMLFRGAFFYPLWARKAKKGMGAKTQVSEFVFEKADVLAFQNGKTAKYPYADCIRLLETRQCFYMIQSDGQGMMLDKENVRGGTADDLRVWLEEKCEKISEWVGKK